ncbi:hypothetical protein [Streptomyces sp. cg2]|uniref:hypothetical protein n=1 Tax=Streptomyces sp. cg2 TaxID=3238799 RepID=UPI0034E2B6F2
MSGEERPERHRQAAGEATRRVWTESMHATARPWSGTRVLVDRSLPLGRLSGVAYPDVWTAVTPIHLSHARVLAGRLRTGVPDVLRDEGGEAACWLDEVCPDCGRPAESQGVPVCTYCHASMAC